MRVLYFTQDYTPHDHRFLSALADAGQAVYSLRLERCGVQREERPLPPQVQALEWRGGRRPARAWDYPALLADLKQVLFRVRPDVLHAGPIQSAACLAALSGFQPLVSMSWGSDLLRDADRSGRMRLITRFTLSHTRVLVGDCQAVQRKAENFGFPARQVVLFPWGVNLEQFSPAAAKSNLRQQLGWEDCFVALSLRSWEPVYGVDVLARAFVRSARQNPDLRLILLGSGSQADRVRAIFRDGGVEDRVHFGGQVGNQQLPAYYGAADLYLSASHSDGSSVSLMEALACACPVLVSDIPGNREWITPGEAGWLFPDGDDAALAQALLAAAADRQQLPAMKLAARSLAEERADWPRNFQKLLFAYEMAVKGKYA